MTEEYQKIYNDLVKKGFSEYQINLLLYPTNQNNTFVKKDSIIWSCNSKYPTCESLRIKGKSNKYFDLITNKLYTYRKVI